MDDRRKYIQGVNNRQKYKQGVNNRRKYKQGLTAREINAIRIATTNYNNLIYYVHDRLNHAVTTHTLPFYLHQSLPFIPAIWIFPLSIHYVPLIHSFIHSFIHLLPMISLVSPQKYRVKRLTRAVPMNACFAICSATLLPTACETPISSLFPLYFPLFFLLIIFKP